MKVYFDYQGEPEVSAGMELLSAPMDRESYKLKITLPAKWVEGPAQKLLDYYCSAYNKKFAEKPLNAEEMKLHCRGVDVPLDATVNKYIQEHNDVLIHHKTQRIVEKIVEGSLVCTNFGCGKRYLPEENGPNACRYHAKPPVFHDVYKYWSCCPDKKTMDFADFEKIEPCCVGYHSQDNKPVEFKSEPVNNMALTAEQAAAVQNQQQASQAMMSGDDCGPQRNGPREFEEAKHTKPQEIVNGMATCRNFGCGQKFCVAENHDEACLYHKGGPVFHDTYKYWKCCPDQKKIDFDDFAAIPGCTRGPHKL